jgi:threonine/homoserine/homoserine lactone efflux protein
MTQTGKTSAAKRGQRVAVTMAATGVFWIAATYIGQEDGWSLRTRALFDLAALAGFGFALWQTFQLWRARQNDDKG